MEERQHALQSGNPPDCVLSPGDHVRVDHRAFTRPVHVLVKLVVLGIDASLWDDLEKFNGTVVDRYKLVKSFVMHFHFCVRCVIYWTRWFDG